MATPTDAEYRAAMKRQGMTDEEDPMKADTEADMEADAVPASGKKRKKKPSSTIGGFLDQVKVRQKMLHDL